MDDLIGGALGAGEACGVERTFWRSRWLNSASEALLLRAAPEATAFDLWAVDIADFGVNGLVASLPGSCDGLAADDF